MTGSGPHGPAVPPVRLRLDRARAAQAVATDPRARVAILVLTGVILVLAVFNAAVILPRAAALGAAVGVDFHGHEAIARNWLATGQLYFPWQLAGPYHVSTETAPVLYPPVILYLLVPFLVLPEPLWWLIPLVALAIVIVRLRPAPWTWPILAAIAWFPRTQEIVLYGNPSMWIAAFSAVGLVLPGVAVAVALKPSLGPFALIGVRHRSWWVAAAVALVACLPFAGLWGDYLTAIRNSDVSAFYSAPDLPLVLAPIVAWVGRTSRLTDRSGTSDPSGAASSTPALR